MFCCILQLFLATPNDRFYNPHGSKPQKNLCIYEYFALLMNESLPFKFELFFSYLKILRQDIRRTKGS